MSADKLVKELADKARVAARTLVAADYKTRKMHCLQLQMQLLQTLL